MLFEEKDLKLSKNFESYQNKLNEEASLYLKTFKDQNSDTVEANIILRQNLSLYKEKYKNTAPLKKIDLIINELLIVFPNADKSTLKLHLEKNGFISERFIFIFFSGIHTIGLLLVLLLLDLSLTTQILTGLFTYLLGLPTTCLLALEIGNNEEIKNK